MTENELHAAVDAAFEITGRGYAPWPDPHPDRSPPEEQYSRLLDPAKWRILGARADAWFTALAEHGLAVVERDVAVEWPEGRSAHFTRIDRVVPLAPGALPIVIARTRLEDVDDAGVVLSVGDPPVLVSLHPDCGCDACDSGSQNDLDELDRHIRGIVAGTFRRLTRGDREITVIEQGGWSARGFWRPHPRDQVAQILADPTGWHEITGTSWLASR